jgi:hypothetical protein
MDPLVSFQLQLMSQFMQFSNEGYGNGDREKQSILQL